MTDETCELWRSLYRADYMPTTGALTTVDQQLYALHSVTSSVTSTRRELESFSGSGDVKKTRCLILRVKKRTNI